MNTHVKWIPALCAAGLMLFLGSGCNSGNQQDCPAGDTARSNGPIPPLWGILSVDIPPAASMTKLKSADAKTLITAYEATLGRDFNHFANVYDLPGNIMEKGTPLPQDDTKGIYVFNSLTPKAGGGFDRFVSMHKMHVKGSKLEIIQSCNRLMFSESNFFVGSPAPATTTLDWLHPMADPVPSEIISFEDLGKLRQGIKEYYRQSNPKLTTDVTKPMNYDDLIQAFLITSDEYNAVLTASSTTTTPKKVRVFIGQDASKNRVLVLACVDGSGRAVIKDDEVFMLDNNHLCPNECDLF